MGLSLSPILSDILMEYFEENYIDNLDQKLIIWWTMCLLFRHTI